MLVAKRPNCSIFSFEEVGIIGLTSEGLVTLFSIFTDQCVTLQTNFCSKQTLCYQLITLPAFALDLLGEGAKS